MSKKPLTPNPQTKTPPSAADEQTSNTVPLAAAQKDSMAALVRDLKACQEFNKALIANSPLGISIRSRSGQLLEYNAAWQRIWAIPDEVVKEDLSRERNQIIFDERDDYLGPYLSAVRRVYTEGSSCFVPEARVKNPRPGGAEWVSQYFFAIKKKDPSGEETEFVERVIVTTEDITQRKRAEQALRYNVERYTLAVRGANDGIWDWDLETGRVFSSGRLKSILGLEENEDGDGVDWLNFVHPEDLYQVKTNLSSHLDGLTPHFISEHRVLRSDGACRWVLARGLATRDEYQRPVRMAGSITDITARKDIEDRLRHDAMHDLLTNLNNRAFFTAQLERFLESAHRRNSYNFALLLIDLDRFQLVNDSLGHAAGDQLLIAVARRLQSCIRPGDTIARLGGDEFVILLDEVKGINEATRFAAQVQQQLAIPLTLRGHVTFTSASIGISMAAPTYQRAEDLLRDADTALNRAKANGKGRYWIFDNELHSQSLALLQLETDLRRAIQHQEFCLYYQPIFDTSQRKIISFEALIRWRHPQKGLIQPHDFIPFAEETSLILPIGEWTMRTACIQAAKWIQQTNTAFKISVNISGRQFQDANLPSLVERALGESGLPGNCLQIEITESAALQDLKQAVQMLSLLKEMGISIAIDDFGTSYSTLTYLKHFPAHAIKIDKTFLEDIDRAGEDPLAAAVIAMGNALKLQVIAEGVESPTQLKFLLARGCNLIQGYLLSHPVPQEDVPSLLKQELNWKRFLA